MKFFSRPGIGLSVLFSALILTGCTSKTVSPASNQTIGDRALVSLTVEVHSEFSRQTIADVTLLVTETAVTDQRSLVSQTATTDALGRATLNLPAGRYLIQPLDRDQYVGGQTVDLRQPTQVELDLTPRQAANSNTTDQ